MLNVSNWPFVNNHNFPDLTNEECWCRGGVGGGARGYLEPARRGQCHPESTHFNKHQHTDTANIANISFTLQDL